MQTILPPSGNTTKILGKARSAEHGLRWMTYVLAQPVEGGVLVFHTLTRALLLLTPEEYAAPDNLPELRSSWFRVPQEMDDMKYADQVRFIRRTMQKEPEHTTTYTIFTTTDCNARCFYCYEMGRSRIPMSNETAHKAAAYIAAHCGGEKVHLHWFGGEPLFNKQVIDIICTDLTEKGIVYESMMISNGYLFDGATVEQAVSHWKLKSVQITLDGTEEIYNRSKAFIYKDGKSPYQVVLANIQRLLDAGVSVHIRLNMDEHNADNLMELADELHERFRGKGKFSVYSHTLFEFAGSKTHIRAQEERRQLYQKQQRLRKNWTIAESEHRTICAKNCVSGNVWRIAAVPLRSCRTGNLGCANITARTTLWEALMGKRQSVPSSKVFENTGSRSRRAKPASITPNVSV